MHFPLEQQLFSNHWCLLQTFANMKYIIAVISLAALAVAQEAGAAVGKEDTTATAGTAVAAEDKGFTRDLPADVLRGNIMIV